MQITVISLLQVGDPISHFHYAVIRVLIPSGVICLLLAALQLERTFCHHNTRKARTFCFIKSSNLDKGGVLSISLPVKFLAVDINCAALILDIGRHFQRRRTTLVQ